jgi:hypothetical protein
MKQSDPDPYQIGKQDPGSGSVSKLKAGSGSVPKGSGSATLPYLLTRLLTGKV